MPTLEFRSAREVATEPACDLLQRKMYAAAFVGKGSPLLLEPEELQVILAVFQLAGIGEPYADPVST